MSSWLIALIVLAVIIIVLVLNAWLSMRGVNMLTEEEFSKDLRKVQLIDIREKDKFNHGHILGARNIPMSTFQMKKSGIRKDIPVYLYDQSGNTALRAARLLKKDGHTDINILKKGISQWKGKIKSKNR
ncbi:rhodanese-like domain-containing protein [Jeotgalicoccus meleagridis]|uniref:Thiosulfate sulfurtransferase GlpE n=1 Tax=Jeotgalicoccus meleagridis TaxID=2759181 RepID=A0A6V7RIY5_9STAP|nr:rhodanese-like domain-containing protein [Jeotgalicoccus meleagridis]CAD2078023.1 Thiosulfate sulfurtransferase GlpE [Jeotgalicoccus meleagridis]